MEKNVNFEQFKLFKNLYSCELFIALLIDSSSVL